MDGAEVTSPIKRGTARRLGLRKPEGGTRDETPLGITMQQAAEALAKAFAPWAEWRASLGLEANA